MARFNLADLFELVAGAVPAREALVAGDVRLTYRELDERANRFASYLRSAGVEPGAWVTVLAWNRAEWLEAFFGCLKARTVPINVNYRYTPDELRYILDNADAQVLVSERSFLPLVAQVRDQLPKLRHVLVLEDGSDADVGDAVRYEDALAAASPGPLGEERSADDLYVLYTGGTTGMPKGVLWRQEDIFFAAMGGGGFGQPPIKTPEELLERIWPDDAAVTALVCAPLMHGAAQWAVGNMVFQGGKIVLFTGHRFDAEAVWDLAERERARSVTVVGDAMARPLADALDAEPERWDLSSIVNIGSGGAIYSPAVKQQLKKHLPNAFTIDTFGASELGAGGAQYEADSGPRFNANEWTTVLDDDLRPVPRGSGVVGRLARRGHIPLGYHKDEAKTAATFVTDPDGVRWAVPGDFCTIEDDGSITLLGRGSQCINSGGEKIYPEEVELALKSHPGVFDALVVGVPDERFGSRVAAVVQARPGFTPTLDELAEHCRQTIAGYKVPRELKLVGEISRTAAGKADYKWARSVFDSQEG